MQYKKAAESRLGLLVVCTLHHYQEEGFFHLSHHFAEEKLHKVYVDLGGGGMAQNVRAVVMILYLPFLLIPKILIKMW